MFWVWSDDLEQARDFCTRVRRLWENNGYVMQQDNMILKILVLSSLPFGLYTIGKNIKNLERDFIAPVPSVTPILPVHGEFAGSGGEPKLIFTGRKEQQADSDLGEMADNKKLIESARKLAFNTREFTSHGFHGKFFVGPSTFDISNDEFVVLELENLKIQPDLYRVVTLLIINAVTQDLYLSDRSRERLVIFDEAWQFLDKGS